MRKERAGFRTVCSMGTGDFSVIESFPVFTGIIYACDGKAQGKNIKNLPVYSSDVLIRTVSIMESNRSGTQVTQRYSMTDLCMEIFGGWRFSGSHFEPIRHGR